MNNHFFITGCVRSGTTLLEKLLCNHHRLSVLAQPFPTLYINVKKSFFCNKNISEYFVLSHYVDENRYRFFEFNDFLMHTTIADSLVLDSINTSYSGCLTGSLQYPLCGEQTLSEIFRKLAENNSHNPEATVFGTKEVLCEEYLPYFIHQGIKTLHIVRDPRDVISSIKKGKGEKYIGNVKPLLFELRNWRKSAQAAIQLKDDPLFLSVKYEDLVLKTEVTLKLICDFLEIPQFKANAFSEGIREQQGGIWASNSSFGETQGIISTTSIGRHHELLPPEVNDYIVAICYPELQQLGMEMVLPKNYEDVIRSFSEPVMISDPNFTGMKNYSNDNMRYELDRLNCYMDGRYSPEFILR